MLQIKTSKSKILKKLERIIRDDDTPQQVKVKAMDLQMRILDNIAGDINYSKPIFIITGARRPGYQSMALPSIEVKEVESESVKDEGLDDGGGLEDIENGDDKEDQDG